MPSTLVRSYSIDSDVSYIRITFLPTLLAASLTNYAFLLATNDASPVSVSDPFETIDVTNPLQYNSIARTITLRFKANKLTASTTYNLTITGVTDVNGNIKPDDSSVQIVVPSTYDAGYLDTLPATAQVIQVTDESINRNIFDSVVELVKANVNFYVESTFPENQEWYINPNENNGRVIITFSTLPSATFLNSNYIKTQRKAIQRKPSRWENLSVKISADNDDPRVYLDFPSYDYYPQAATPSTTVVYATPGYGYFEEGYKYRIILSKSMGT